MSVRVIHHTHQSPKKAKGGIQELWNIGIFGGEVGEGAQHWTLITPENTLGNFAASPDARPVKLGPQYDWVWEYFRSEQRKARQDAWFPAKPPEYSVILDEMLYNCFRYRKTIGCWNGTKVSMPVIQLTNFLKGSAI